MEREIIISQGGIVVFRSIDETFGFLECDEMIPGFKTWQGILASSCTEYEYGTVSASKLPEVISSGSLGIHAFWCFWLRNVTSWMSLNVLEITDVCT
jgi:hypothetical protein